MIRGIFLAILLVGCSTDRSYKYIHVTFEVDIDHTVEDNHSKNVVKYQTDAGR